MEKEIIIEELKNSGLVHKEPSPENYHSLLFNKYPEKMGGILSPVEPPPVIFENGKGWAQVAKEYGHPELQFNRNFDTFCCVLFGIAKALCYHTYKYYGIKYTVAEMYNAFFAGVKPGIGTSVEAGMQSFKNYGWVEDKDYPLTPDMSAEQFFKKPPQYIQLRGKDKLITWKFNWNVIPKSYEAIYRAYRRTPVVLTGFAWASYYGTGVYYDYNNPPNHCFVGLEELENHNNLITDNYPKDFQYVENSQISAGDLFKELDRDFKYGSAHTCWLTPVNPKISLLNLLINMLKNLKMNFWVDKNDHSKGLANGEVFIVKDGKKKKVDDINDVMAVLEINFGIEKTDWGELGQFQTVDKL